MHKTNQGWPLDDLKKLLQYTYCYKFIGLNLDLSLIVQNATIHI